MIFIWLFVVLKFHFCWIMTCICLDARTFLNDINSRVLLIGFKYDNSNFYSAGHIESHLSTFIDDQSTDSVIQVEKNFVWGDRNQYGWCWRVMARRLVMMMTMTMVMTRLTTMLTRSCNNDYDYFG